MRYPQSFMDALKSRFLVSQVVGRRVSLRRHGREYMGLCPFHKEKSPSFTVNDEKGFYHCFGCGAHGDSIGFLKEYENISYREAVERLANEAGMAVPQPTREEAEREQVRHSLQDASEAACQWFQEQLQLGSHYEALQYLKQRGLTDATIQRFRIGFAPDEREGLKRELLGRGFQESQLIEAGLLIQPEGGRAAYSRFRGRIMFPIRDVRSRVVAFGGRILPNSGQTEAAKYLNSPETELFKKGQMLYNADLARRPAMDAGAVVICEGYMDVIALAQAGIDYAVAPLGTAVTPTQLNLLWQMADAPVMCLDGDAAGIRAMQRASELALPLLAPGKSLHFARLPKGQDPDDVVRERGADGMKALIAQAPGLAEMLWMEVAGQGAGSPEEKAGQEHRLMQLAEAIQHATVKAHYRAYFKEKIWARPENASGKAGAGKGFTSGQRGGQQQDLRMPSLPSAHDQQSHARRAMLECVKLVLLYPQLLQDDYAREEFMRIESTDQALNLLCQQIADCLMDDPAMERGALHEALTDMGAEAQVTRVLETDEFAIRKQREKDVSGQQLPHAQRMWMQAINAYQLAAVTVELKQAEMEMAQGLSEATLDRVNALRAQVATMEQQREQLLMQYQTDAG